MFCLLYFYRSSFFCFSRSTFSSFSCLFVSFLSGDKISVTDPLFSVFSSFCELSSPDWFGWLSIFFFPCSLLPSPLIISCSFSLCFLKYVPQHIHFLQLSHSLFSMCSVSSSFFISLLLFFCSFRYVP